MPQELFVEIASYLAFEDKRNLSQASRTCYLRSGIIKPENRRQWIRYLQSQCRYLPSNRLHLKSYSSMEVCEACLEIVPYQEIQRDPHFWWVENEHAFRLQNPYCESRDYRLANSPFRPANYVGVCSVAGVRWTHEQWDELACRRCRYYRREMVKTLCREKGQCKKWQVEKKVPVTVRMWKKMKTVVKSVLAVGKCGIRRSNRAGRV